MTRTVYVNGEYLPETEAKISIFDRAFLMADGVYEVTSVLGGKLIDFDGHAKRLQGPLERRRLTQCVEFGHRPFAAAQWIYSCGVIRAIAIV